MVPAVGVVGVARVRWTVEYAAFGGVVCFIQLINILGQALVAAIIIIDMRGAVRPSDRVAALEVIVLLLAVADQLLVLVGRLEQTADHGLLLQSDHFVIAIWLVGLVLAALQIRFEFRILVLVEYLLTLRLVDQKASVSRSTVLLILA